MTMMMVMNLIFVSSKVCVSSVVSQIEKWKNIVARLLEGEYLL